MIILYNFTVGHGEGQESNRLDRETKEAIKQHKEDVKMAEVWLNENDRFLLTHNSGGDIAVHFPYVSLPVSLSVTFWLKFFSYGCISLTINEIAFIFYTHLPKCF